MRTRRTAWMAGMLLGLLMLSGCGAPAPSVPPKPIHIRFSVTDLAIVPQYLYIGLSGVAGINRYGQVAGNLSAMGFLWTPTTPNGTTGRLIDFNQILAPASATAIIKISAINEYGQVAGEVDERAFLWTPTTPNGAAGGVTDLSPASAAVGLNEWGQVVTDLGLWTPTTPNGMVGATTTIPQLPNDSWGQPLGINGYGQVIGTSYGRTDVINRYSYSHAFVWTPNAPHGTIGTMTAIGSDGFGVSGINEYGEVLGSIYGGAAFVWAPSSANGTRGHFTKIAALSGDDEVDFYRINSFGAAAGTSVGAYHLFPHPGFGGNHAVVWMPAARNGTTGKLLTLGGVGSDADSEAGAINSSGEVVGSSCTLRHDGPGTPYCTSQSHVFIWDDKHGLHDLQRLIDPRAGMTLGESVETIESISDAGQIVIEGQAPDSQTHLLLLTPQP